jgi:hypothetical protein
VTRGFTLDIADLAIGVTSDDDLPIAVEGSARKFVAEGERASAPLAARLHARWGDPAVPADGEVSFDSGKGLWRLHRTPRGATFVFTSSALGPLPYQTADFEPGYARGTVTLRREVFADRLPMYPLHYPLDEVFMVHLLSRGLGVELHGGGVVMPDGRGYLFVGQSGAGKTTLSKLWLQERGITVLSDERIIVRRRAGEAGMWMYGTPWHGDGRIATPGRVPLSRVFFLRHGTGNALKPLPRTEAAARLFACGFTPFHDADGLDFTLGLLGDVAAAVPCEEPSFVPDRSAVAFVSGL